MLALKDIDRGGECPQTILRDLSALQHVTTRPAHAVSSLSEQKSRSSAELPGSAETETADKTWSVEARPSLYTITILFFLLIQFASCDSSVINGYEKDRGCWWEWVSRYGDLVIHQIA